MGEPDEKGYRKIYFELNGQQRNVGIKDEKLADVIKSNVKGDLGNPKDVCATMPGKIVKINVKEGDSIKKDDLLVVTEAMKIETKIKAGISGKVEKVFLNEGDRIEAGDLIIKIA
jgi:pyruvate carboxylase